MKEPSCLTMRDGWENLIWRNKWKREGKGGLAGGYTRIQGAIGSQLKITEGEAVLRLLLSM